MSRIHLFEFEDLRWFPANIRNYETDFLQYLSNQTGMWKVIAPIIDEGLHKSNTQTIVDLASGGGGALLGLNSLLVSKTPKLQIILSDYYPNLKAFERIEKLHTNIKCIKTSVDAKSVPVELKGLRTQFLSFHHFKPEDGIQILQNALDEEQGIVLFEAQNRGFKSILFMLLSPISVILTTPFIRPFSWGRLFFTYLVPIVPLVVCWDGVVSSLRTYSEKELKQLIQKVQNQQSYNWEFGTVKSGPTSITYLLATKKHND